MWGAILQKKLYGDLERLKMKDTTFNLELKLIFHAIYMDNLNQLILHWKFWFVTHVKKNKKKYSERQQTVRNEYSDKGQTVGKWQLTKGLCNSSRIINY